MRKRLPRYAGTACRTAIIAASLAFLASCTTAGAPVLQADTPSYTSTTAVTEDGSTALAAAAAEDGGTMVADTGDLPQQVATVPTKNPAATATAEAPAANALVAPSAGAQAATALPAPAQPGAATDAQAAAANKPVAPTAGDKPTTAAAPAVDPATAGDGSVVVAAAAMPPAQKKQGFLASFFGAGAPSGGKAKMRDSSSAPKAQIAKAEVKPAEIKTARATLPVDVAAEGDGGEPADAFASGGGNDLPGVRKTALFEIKRRSGMDDDADVDIYEEEDGGVQLASAAGMARLAPNGLLRQTESVDVACLKPSLVRALKQIERHYGKKMVVTSGYRSPSHNRRARGAKNSLHMYCAAADIQVPGVGKWELASYARSIQGRGGVGTYCHTNSIHVDVGPERDWNWRCRSRRRK